MKNLLRPPLKPAIFRTDFALRVYFCANPLWRLHPCRSSTLPHYAAVLIALSLLLMKDRLSHSSCPRVAMCVLLSSLLSSKLIRAASTFLDGKQGGTGCNSLCSRYHNIGLQVQWRCHRSGRLSLYHGQLYLYAHLVNLLLVMRLTNCCSLTERQEGYRDQPLPSRHHGWWRRRLLLLGA